MLWQLLVCCYGTIHIHGLFCIQCNDAVVHDVVIRWMCIRMHYTFRLAGGCKLFYHSKCQKIIDTQFGSLFHCQLLLFGFSHLWFSFRYPRFGVILVPWGTFLCISPCFLLKNGFHLQHVMNNKTQMKKEEKNSIKHENIKKALSTDLRFLSLMLSLNHNFLAFCLSLSLSHFYPLHIFLLHSLRV